MKDSIVINMKYAAYDMIDGTPNYTGIIFSVVLTGRNQMKMAYGFHLHRNTMKEK